MSEARNIQPPRDPVIPDKLYFRIGEVARLLNVETHTLRFWETEFPQLKVGKGGTGQRLYRRRDVELVLEIKQLLYEQGYTIPGARQLLQSRQRRSDAHRTKPEAAAPQPGTADPRSSGLERIHAELRDLRDLLDGPPSGPGAGEVSRPLSRTVPATPSRRGLHLAAAKPPRDAHFSSKSESSATLPGLFDPKSE
ncbi:MerR family transcriptional regulator [Terriglobus aquaticus]|uniref:MerR family transcriptional regulator n=1 Tax=Terriglobus aquaticus TaxID=940139 RepID=A0ABW9KG15_9BACT|nr:MerR family transcriptional regulator [Terriglobus aquaticus]